MSSDAIRDALQAVIAAVPEVGTVHDRERYANQQSKLAALYGYNGGIRGGFLRRAAYRKVSDDGGHDYTVTTDWEIHYFSSFLDEAESENEFNARIDDIDAALRADVTLGGAVESTVTPGQSGLALVSNQPAMFAGVLVHYAKLTVQTEHSVTD